MPPVATRKVLGREAASSHPQAAHHVKGTASTLHDICENDALLLRMAVFASHAGKQVHTSCHTVWREQMMCRIEA